MTDAVLVFYFYKACSDVQSNFHLNLVKRSKLNYKYTKKLTENLVKKLSSIEIRTRHNWFQLDENTGKKKKLYIQ